MFKGFKIFFEELIVSPFSLYYWININCKILHLECLAKLFLYRKNCHKLLMWMVYPPDINSYIHRILAVEPISRRKLIFHFSNHTTFHPPILDFFFYMFPKNTIQLLQYIIIINSGHYPNTVHGPLLRMRRITALGFCLPSWAGAGSQTTHTIKNLRGPLRCEVVFPILSFSVYASHNQIQMQT